jgi:DNA-binding MarR family transcriptional regulator
MAQKNLDSDTSELALALGLLIRKIRSSAPPEQRDFSWTQRAILTRLDREGPMTTADLARAEGVKPQSMGTAIALLEETGLVERKAHPTDGRQMNIRLTAKGSALRKTTREAKENWLSQAIAKLDRNDQATLFKAGEIIKRLVEL